MSFISLLLYIITIYIRPQEWVPAMLGMPLIFILTLATAFFALVENSSRKKAYLWETPNRLLLVFFGCILLSHISHMNLQSTIDSFNNFLPNVIMFFLFVNIITTEKRIKITIWLLILLAVILAIGGIQQYNNGIGWAGQVPFYDTSRAELRIRWIGIFNDPNDLALVYVVGAGFLFSFLFGQSSVLVKIISLGMLSIILRALYYTNSRGGFLALLTTVGFFFLSKIKNKILALSIGGLCVFAVIMFGPSRLSEVSASEASAYGRIESWYQGFLMLKSAPFFGIGYNMFIDYHERAAHNSYINVAAETGMIGFYSWITLIFISFKGLIIASKKDKAPIPYIMGIEGGLAGFLAASYFLSRSYIMLLYLLLALASACIYTSLKSEEYAFTKEDIKRSALLSIGILSLVWISMKISI